MTKYNFKIRRGVFRSGNVRGAQNFQRFEQRFRQRKRTQNRMRNLIIMIFVIIITIALIFFTRTKSESSSLNQSHLSIENVHQNL